MTSPRQSGRYEVGQVYRRDDGTEAGVVSESQSHRCFGCGHAIGDHEPHIHVGLDEWGEANGLDSLDLGGELDDLLTFAFCEPCTEKSERDGWTLEAHEVES